MSIKTMLNNIPKKIKDAHKPLDEFEVNYWEDFDLKKRKKKLRKKKSRNRLDFLEKRMKKKF